jgi:hypothetical protein
MLTMPIINTRIPPGWWSLSRTRIAIATPHFDIVIRITPISTTGTATTRSVSSEARDQSPTMRDDPGRDQGRLVHACTAAPAQPKANAN